MNFAKLNGASVRDSKSKQLGRIVAISEDTLEIAWMTGGALSEDMEMASNVIPDALEVLTLEDGWVTLNSLEGLKSTGEWQDPADANPTRELIGDLKSLQERSSHNPWQHQTSRGALPKISTKGCADYGGETHHLGSKADKEVDEWECIKVAKYHQYCYKLKNGHRIPDDDYPRGFVGKDVVVNPAYKDAYDHGYKKYVKGEKKNRKVTGGNRVHFKDRAALSAMAKSPHSTNPQHDPNNKDNASHRLSNFSKKHGRTNPEFAPSHKAQHHTAHDPLHAKMMDKISAGKWGETGGGSEGDSSAPVGVSAPKRKLSKNPVEKSIGVIRRAKELSHVKPTGAELSKHAKKFATAHRGLAKNTPAPKVPTKKFSKNPIEKSIGVIRRAKELSHVKPTRDELRKHASKFAKAHRQMGQEAEIPEKAIANHAPKSIDMEKLIGMSHAGRRAQRAAKEARKLADARQHLKDKNFKKMERSKNKRGEKYDRAARRALKYSVGKE